MSDELENMRKKAVGTSLRYYLGISLEELRIITKTLGQNFRSPSQDLNPGAPEYVIRVKLLTARTRRSVL
jgi:hypothetical protein